MGTLPVHAGAVKQVDGVRLRASQGAFLLPRGAPSALLQMGFLDNQGHLFALAELWVVHPKTERYPLEGVAEVLPPAI